MSQLARTINGRHTEIVVQNYVDRVLVLVTQVGKVGNLIQASIPSTILLLSLKSSGSNDDLPVPPASIELTPILGGTPSDHVRVLYNLYASHIATLVWLSGAGDPTDVSRRSVVVGLALANASSGEQGIGDEERKTFRAIMDMVKVVLAYGG